MDDDTISFIWGLLIGTIVTSWLGLLVFIGPYGGTATVVSVEGGYTWHYQGADYVISNYDTDSCGRIQDLLEKME